MKAGDGAEDETGWKRGLNGNFNMKMRLGGREGRRGGGGSEMEQRISNLS